MGKDQFVRRACGDLGIPVTVIDVPDNASATKLMDALVSALEVEYGKEE